MKESSQQGSTASAVILSSILLFSQLANAQIITLTDPNGPNSLVQVQTSGSGAGMFNWTVDGHDYLANQWFWYRVGASGGESRIDTISAPTITTPDAQTLYTRYNNGSYGVEVDYVLTGSSLGSGHSQINESISITNGTGSTLDFHFFQYSDFDLGASDGVKLTRSLPDNLWQKADQTNSLGASLSESIGTVVPHATHAEAGLFNTTLNALNDANPSTLNDVAGAGPGDVTWAFEWDLSIAPGSSVLISKIKTLQVPEPSIVTLAVLGVAGLALRRRQQSGK
jgi:hypothetical protein